MQIYIIIFFIVLGITIWGWMKDGGLSEAASIVGTVVTMFMTGLSFAPIFDYRVDKLDAVSTKVGDVIVVQVSNEPTQMVTDIKFIDKPLVIIKDTNVNLYGLVETSTYSVEIKKVEK